MLSSEEFKTLTNENKRLVIETYLLPLLKDQPNGTWFLETFVFWATDEELCEFYEVILHPEKKEEYIAKQGAKIKSMNNEIHHLYQLFKQAKNEMQEGLEKENAESILQNI